MELFSSEFFSSLLAIIIMDLVLAGDNAIVIGLAARNVPAEKQKKAIFWGIAGAIIVRALLTIFVVWLLKIPGLLFAGGMLLIWIAFKLLVEEKGHGEMKSEANLWGAVKTIIIADAVMGVDNVLAVAGAAHGSVILVVMGLMVSIPIVVWGSTIIIKWVERFPVIIYIGAGVLAWTASKMIADEPFLHGFFEGNSMLKWGLSVIIITAVLLAGKIKKQKQLKNKQVPL